MDSTVFWLSFFILSLLLEIVASPGLFYFLAFSCGAAAAALAALFNFGLSYEITLFLGVTVASFLLLTRFIKRISKDTLHKSNVYALQGKRAVVTETIASCQKGWVKVDGGEVWAAVGVDDSIIEKGSLVEVVSSAGSHLKVKKIKDYC